MFYFLSLFSIYCLCEKHYKPITVQYYIADCVSLIPRLISLGLQTNWTYEHGLRTEFTPMSGTYSISVSLDRLVPSSSFSASFTNIYGDLGNVGP